MKNQSQTELNKFAKRIAKARKKSGQSLSVLADQCNVSKSSVAHYEEARCWPSAPTLAKICAALEVTSDHLLGLTK